MRHVPIILILVMTLMAALPSWAQTTCPEGNFTVKGWNPGVNPSGKESYTGSVSIKTVGEACQLNWKIGLQSFGGLGFYDALSKTLHVAYSDLKAGWFGIVSYKDNGSVLNGKWAVYGDKTGKLGTENLTKQP